MARTVRTRSSCSRPTTTARSAQLDDDEADRGVHGRCATACARTSPHGHAYAVAVVNHRRAAGASIAHPHAQVVRARLRARRRSLAAAIARRGDAGDDLARATTLARARDHDAVLDRRRRVSAWCPHASASPYLAPRRATGAPGRASTRPTDDELAAVALAAARRAGAPGRARSAIRPTTSSCTPRAADGTGRLAGTSRSRRGSSVVAGFEQATGILVNTMPPERAAAVLRAGASMSVTVHVCTTIDAPLDDGLARGRTHRDPHRVDAGRGDASRSRASNDAGVGAAFDCLTRVGPLHTTDHFVVTRWEPPRSWASSTAARSPATPTSGCRAVGGDATEFCWEERLGSRGGWAGRRRAGRPPGAAPHLGRATSARLKASIERTDSLTARHTRVVQGRGSRGRSIGANRR